MKKESSAINLKKSNSAKSNASLKGLNLSKYASQLSSLNIKEKKERENIYIYPDDYSKEDIKGERGKKFRNSIRNQRDRISNNILSYAKSNNLEKLKEEIQKWESFYSANYRLQDYKIESLSNSKDEKKNENLAFALQIISDFKGLNPKKRNASKKKIASKKNASKSNADASIKEESK